MEFRADDMGNIGLALRKSVCTLPQGFNHGQFNAQ
jgi:hypothetical protein